VQYASLQLYIHAVVAGILASVVDDGIALLRSRERSFSHALSERPADDPLYQKQLGELAATAYIAKSAVLDAAAAIDAATTSETDGVPDAQLAAEAQLKVAKVKVHLDDVAPQAATRLLELGGAKRGQPPAQPGSALAQHPHHHAAQPGGLQGAGDRPEPIARHAHSGQRLFLNYIVRLWNGNRAQRGICSTNRRQEHRQDDKATAPGWLPDRLPGHPFACGVAPIRAADTAFTTPDYYHRIGRILERGKFDFLFFADLLAAPVRFGNDITEPLRRGTQATATLDPSIVAASVGAVTSKLGIAITKSATLFLTPTSWHGFSPASITSPRAGWRGTSSPR